MERTSNGFQSKHGNKTPKAWATMIIWKINVIKKIFFQQKIQTADQELKRIPINF